MSPLSCNLPEGVQEQLTSHAMLVPWGLYAREIGLLKSFVDLPVDQRTRDHTPQAKFLEFFVAHLQGCRYLQDMSQGEHPLDQDVVVAQAWARMAGPTTAA